MTDRDDDDAIDARLQRLARSTEQLTAPQQLLDRIVSKAHDEAPLAMDAWRAGRRSLLAFALAAAAMFVVARVVRSDVYQRSLSTLDPVEVVE